MNTKVEELQKQNATLTVQKDSLGQDINQKGT
jgi:hypothetical protein